MLSRSQKVIAAINCAVSLTNQITRSTCDILRKQFTDHASLVNIGQPFVAAVDRYLQAGNIEAAAKVCATTPAPALSRATRNLLKLLRNGMESPMLAVEESLMEVRPLVVARVGWLWSIANIATLIGLIGTIFGLIGAFKAVAADFDGDGDLDLAAISFFPDLARSPEEAFLYFENLGGMRFKASTIPLGTRGRWLTLEAGDLDGDGDLDMILGSFTQGPASVPIPEAIREGWRTNEAGLLLLENVGFTRRAGGPLQRGGNERR